MIILKIRKENKIRYFDLKSLDLHITISNDSLIIDYEDNKMTFKVDANELWLLSNNVVIDHIVPYKQKIDN